MEGRNKENAHSEFFKMISKSWTYGKLTEAEKNNLIRLFTKINSATELKHNNCYRLRGTWAQRWEQLNVIYSSFLAGCGYNGGLWREETSCNFDDTTEIPF